MASVDMETPTLSCLSGGSQNCQLGGPFASSVSQPRPTPAHRVNRIQISLGDPNRGYGVLPTPTALF